MAIETDNIVVFQELFDTAWEYLKNKCHNIGRLDLPSGATSNYSKTIQNGRGGVKCTINNSTVPSQYSEDAVKGNFISFLQQRNVYNKADALISSKGILMFWNAVAAFCESNCTIIVGQFVDSSNPYVIYEPKNDYQPKPSVEDDDQKMSDDDINTLLDNLDNIIASNVKVHKIIYNISAFSCSSSSAFVGYIKR